MGDFREPGLIVALLKPRRKRRLWTRIEEQIIQLPAAGVALMTLDQCRDCFGVAQLDNGLLRLGSVKVRDFACLAVDVDDVDRRAFVQRLQGRLPQPIDLAAQLVQLRGGVACVFQPLYLLGATLQFSFQAVHRVAQLAGRLPLLFQFFQVDDWHQKENDKEQQQYVDERNEKARDAAARHDDHGASSAAALPPPPSDTMSSRPMMTIHGGRILTNAMNKPAPVAVMAGAYLVMMSCGLMSGWIELNVCKMPPTVPNRPSSGNHSAAWARWLTQRSADSSKPAPRQRSAL